MLHVLSFLSYLVSLSLLAALAFRDMKDYILPNKMNAALALSFFAFHISINWQIISPTDSLSGVMAGAGLLLFIRFFANRFYKEDALGLGDVKLMAAGGIGLGFPNILLAMSLGALLGLCHGLYLAIRHKKSGQKVCFEKINVPAGLGLALGIAIVMATQFGFSWLK